FPHQELNDIGYTAAIHGQKGLNGVAFLSKEPARNVVTGYLPDWPVDCRVIRADFGDYTFINTYIPNGTVVGIDKWDYKMRWLDAFPEYLSSFATPQDPLVWLGDINVAPGEIDVHDHRKLLGQVGHHPDEFTRLDKIVNWGWTECFRKQHPEAGHYTFWDFRVPKAYERGLGWRIDHVYVTEPVLPKTGDCWVDAHLRIRDRPSDHAPILIRLA
ncbi:MAG: exodeoxyribonuclease III, partial [bacterium]